MLLLRSREEGCAALFGGFARTVEGEYLLRTGWAHALVADRVTLRAAAPQVAITGATDRELERDPHARSARMPRTAHDAVREGLNRGPVLLQTPRQGYATALACDACRTPGPLPGLHRAAAGPGGAPAADVPMVRHRAARPGPARSAAAHGLRAPVLGDRRTAEEIGRAFPQVPVRTSSGDRVLADVDAVPSIVVATPGAEPVVEGGYACVVLLDTWLMLSRADLRTDEESAAALARRRRAGPARRTGAVASSPSASRPVPRCRRWCAGTRVGSQAGSWRSGCPPTCRPARGWRR